MATTPIDRAALSLIPLLIEARTMLAGTGLTKDGDADEAICGAFDAIIQAAETVSYRMLRKASFRDGDECRNLMNRIDDALSELHAIDRGEAA